MKRRRCQMDTRSLVLHRTPYCGVESNSASFVAARVGGPRGERPFPSAVARYPNPFLPARRRSARSIELTGPIMRVRGSHTETLKSILHSAVRSEDKQLDYILGALEEISIASHSRVPDRETLSHALRRAARGALKQALLDRELR